MKTTLNKSIKRALSICLAFAVVIGSLFVANVGVSIKADAATLNIKYWDGTEKAPTKTGDTYIINDPAELAYIAKNGSTAGETYKVADGIDAFIMQPQNSVAATKDDDANGVADILEFDSYIETKDYFQDSSITDKKSWYAKSGTVTGYFEGTFDGNGISIYGIYYGGKGWVMSGLFPAAGANATIKNVALRNSTFMTQNNTGALVGYSTGAGTITIDTCEVTNCWIYHTNTETGKSSQTEKGFSDRTGVVVGNIAANLTLNNCIIYGNKAESETYEFGIFAVVKNSSGNTYTNLLVLDSIPYSRTQYNSCDPNQCTFENIYSNDSLDRGVIPKARYSGKILPIDSDGAKGSLGKLAMDFDWAKDGDTANGKWYAIDGEYPTLFKPEGWQDCATITPWAGGEADFTEGTGVEGDPYIIETAEQLWKMVKTGGKVDGVPKYYKVKDGVENLYLSKAISGGYAAVKELAGKTEGTDYYNWNPDTWTAFLGNFDGNGVTIRGMISKSTNNFKQVGFLGVLGEDAIVKNVNFDTCYAHNTAANNSAILASQAIGMKDENSDGTTSNCKYCKQYAENGTYCEFHNTYNKSSAPNGTDKDGSGAVENCGDTQVSTCTTPDLARCETHQGAKDGYSLVYNVSVRNSSIKSTSNTACAGIVCSFNGNPDMLQFVNCLYDGFSCELGNGVADGSTNNYNAGIASYTWGINNFQASGCVSLNAPIGQEYNAPNQYNDYTTGTGSGHPVYTYNCYTTVPKVVESTIVYVDGINADSDAEDYYTEMPLLDWANGWQIVVCDDGREVPMPRVRTANDVFGTWDTGATVLDYNRWLANDGAGASAAPYNGSDGRFYELPGSGTEADPYIISTAIELARVIAAGGTAANSSLYFKLANDIDVGGMPWINTVGARPTNASASTNWGLLKYVPFVGHLDGDGHTVYGLYAVNGNDQQLAFTSDWQAGLIPVLDGGSITNLHIRNGYAGSGLGTTGILVGEMINGTITGCSAEGIVDTLVGTKTAGTVVNSYINDTYYNANGDETTADAIDLTTGVWYKGGYEGAMPKLVNRAKAMEQVDVSGMGDGDYDAYDLTALQNKLLNRKAYKNIYGDVNRNGVTNIADLVVLRRAVNQSYNELVDGFWRNVELGNIAIYYSENDTQDMARKLELYFEGEVAGIDMHKYAVGNAVTDSSLTAEEKVDAAPTQNAIIITQGDPTQVEYNKYSVTFDEAKNLVTIYGGSFTAVEQAVINFMANSSRDANIVYTVADGDILTENKTTDIKITATEVDNYLASSESTSAEYSYKQRVTVGGKTYYYAWGDEFMDNANDTITSDNWKLNSYRGEDAGKTYLNQENANLKDIKDLWVVNEGRLQIWRGVNTDTLTSSINGYDAYSWGYKPLSLGKNTKNDFGRTIDEDDVYIDPGMITTVNSMLFKQGYVEMEASLPSDGHAFPAWWFLTYNNDKNNTSISNSLYGKIFKLNDYGTNKWDETTTGNFTPGVLSTYKYQVPTAHLEFDIVEPMQYRYNGTETSAYLYPSGTFSSYKKDPDTYNHYKRDFNLTVHKIYKEHSKDDVLSIVNWDEKTGGSIEQTVALDDFNTTTTGDFIHKYDNTKYGGYQVGGSWINTDYYGAYKLNRKMTQTVKYGFAWYADASNGTYGIDVYVDGENVMSIDKETGHASEDYLFSNSKDAETWNQYAYMLIDNCFYTANAGAGEQFTDLLTQDTSGFTDYNSYANYQVLDKTTFEINYVRVYQEDGKRDIVTRDTEAFNNGNHYGYGS